MSDFPNNPNVGDRFSVGSLLYEWNGTAWVLVGTPALPQWEVVSREEDPAFSGNFIDVPVASDFQQLRLSVIAQCSAAGASADGDFLEMLVRNDADTQWFGWNSMRSAWSNSATTWNTGTETTDGSSLTIGVIGRYGMRSRFDIELARGDSLWQVDTRSRTITNFASGAQVARNVTGYTTSEYTDVIGYIRLTMNLGSLDFSGITYSLEGLRP